MKLGCILPIVAIGFVAVGAEGLYVGLTNRTPTTMTYHEFLQKKPSSGWIEISDARLNLLSAIHETNRFTGTIKKVYIPVSSSAEVEGGSDEKIHLLLLTKDEAILNTLKGLEAATGGGGGLIGRLERRVDADRKGTDATEKPAGDAGFENAFASWARTKTRSSSTGRSVACSSSASTPTAAIVGRSRRWTPASTRTLLSWRTGRSRRSLAPPLC